LRQRPANVPTDPPLPPHRWFTTTMTGELGDLCSGDSQRRRGITKKQAPDVVAAKAGVEMSRLCPVPPRQRDRRRLNQWN
jgi:hypothetical protein